MRSWAGTAAGVYGGAIAAVTLWPTHTDRPVTQPVAEAARDAGATPAQTRDALSGVDILGNVALFVPLGLLLAVALGRRWWLAIPAGAALSTAIELAQHLWLPGRTGTVRDVLCNAAGAAIGAGYVRVVCSSQGYAYETGSGTV